MKRILLVEDDLDDQSIFKEALKSTGHPVQLHIASNGHEAFEYLEKLENYDLIFLDLNMPLLDGFETLRTLKETDKYRDIPVYILSTSNNEGDKTLCKTLGAKAYISKPTNYKALNDWLNQVFSTHLV